MVLGSFCFIGIGIMAAILPLMYVERGAQMVFVIQSVLLLFSGVYYSVEVLPAGCSWSPTSARHLRARRGAGGADRRGRHRRRCCDDVWPLLIMGVVFIPLGLWAFGRAERYAKRTGKLKRVG